MANPVKIKAIVTAVVKHTDSVVSYGFAPQGRVPKFRAGQFLHLALDEYHPDAQWPESRVFSIASAPSKRCDELAITTSEKGSFTKRISQTLEEGSECWLKLPYGEFTFPKDAHLTLIAGGVGITPFLSLLNQMLEDKSAQSIVLYLGIRSVEYHIFREFLQRCDAELPNFDFILYTEDGSLSGEIGRMDLHKIHSDAPSDSTFYLSGPLAMIKKFKKNLLSLGVPSERIRVDDWE